jgi:exopolyphosphatase/guanosine-5'-triphosphate,3'-diphosphate pyrophosphatase
MPSVACLIDCGTSSVRASIAEIDGARARVLEELSYPVELTAGFTGNPLPRESQEEVERAIAGVVASARGYGCERFRAVATTGLREAPNADVLIERIRVRLGVELEVIDGAEEARLYFEAMRQLARRLDLVLGGDLLLIEIGGGSSCLSLIREGKLAHTVDEHFGTHRLWEQFRQLKDSVDFSVSIHRFALGAARMMLSRLPVSRVDRLAVTGSVVRRLGALASGGEMPVGGWMRQPLAARAIADWLERVRPLTLAQRAEACACDEPEAGRLMPAASLIHHLCGLTGAEQVLVPDITLRHGLLADLLPGAQGPHHLDADHLLAEARQLVARYGGNADYAENTASLAVQIFDQTTALHGFGARERLLLEFSALVHDIGAYINVRNRHKHTMYLIQASDIAGLTAEEKAVVAQVARYHRRSAPQPHHAAYQALPRRDRVRVAGLAALLRLAYGLDLERNRRIRQVRCEVVDGALLIHVDRRQIALEQWSVQQKCGMFREAFGLPVRVVPRVER